MFQGARHTDEENAGNFGFEPSEIDYLLLTHAHLDHCGRIPLLVKRGFAGKIITTAATRELPKLILIDSAHIQEEDAIRASRHKRRGGHKDIRPLYDQIDVLFALDFFGQNVSYDEDVALNDAVTVRFINASHILGSASVVMEVTEHEKTKRIVFSGDLGSPSHAILSNSTLPPECDYVVMETTYGGRMHKDRETSNTELTEVIAETVARGGNVVIPTLAMERTQEILFHLKMQLRAKIYPGLWQSFWIARWRFQQPRFFDVTLMASVLKFAMPCWLDNTLFIRLDCALLVKWTSQGRSIA